MKICYIIGAGELPLLYINNKKEHLTIAADGGLAALGGIKPDVIVGDFDSLGFVPDCENTVKLPVEKDVTDMRSAVDIGFEKGYKCFVIYGGTGGRPDHTFANYALLSYIAHKGGRGYLAGDGFIATAIENETLSLPLKKDGTISVFAVEGDAQGVTIKGLKYTISDHNLSYSHTLGVSNSFTGREACVSADKGKLLVFWEEENLANFVDNLN